MMKGSDLFIKALESEGVEYIFGIPGEENLDFLNSLKESSIKLILTRHEQGAGFMAATYGRLTGKTGVCLSTLGPGATNLVTAAAYAQLGAMPMLMITGQKPIKESQQASFQIVDVVEMMRPLTKQSHQITSAYKIPALVRDAFRSAEDERPGAVHLELPEDIARENSDARIIPRSNFETPHASENSINAAVEMIESAHHPLILIGAGANRRHTRDALKSLIEKSGIPFFSTQLGKGVVDSRNPLFLGNAALSSGDFIHRAIEESDLIINVGHDVVEKPPFLMESRGGEEPITHKVIHINYITAAVDAVYYPQQGVLGDMANSVERLSDALTPQPHWDFRRFKEVRAHLEKHLSQGITKDKFPIDPRRLVVDLRRAVNERGIIALDNGVYKIWFARNYKSYHPNTVLLDNALATMGAGLPSAIAAKIIYPERQVVAVCGDGGFMMNSQEMETAVRLNLDLVVLVLRDNAYGMIKWKQANMGFDEYALDYGNPDFVLYAESYGAIGHRIETTADLLPTIEQCLASNGVHLIEVPIDYSENDIILNHKIKTESQKI
ncbi:MAG: acetolactate synthase large subunit [Thiotrichales bacterium]|nr:acetolactate synthase large subunit [Thiotrichales bacterium]MBT3613297.1 acetolactate synthase large subunit [Thiotrichales bacterium]MBT3751798.1 acetolactate synthase large subunit [Thiotrichales bacterium]MBT3838071.1 acetolactate synthase large subunit [Thiotrichales bacterium]MBT4152016.1 acetolactate synthase large subunit [Thiotrichales bacterium]